MSTLRPQINGVIDELKFCASLFGSNVSGITLHSNMAIALELIKVYQLDPTCKIYFAMKKHAYAAVEYKDNKVYLVNPHDTHKAPEQFTEEFINGLDHI